MGWRDLAWPLRPICYENAPVTGYSTTYHMLIDLDYANLISLYRIPQIIEKIIGYSSYIVAISSIRRVRFWHDPIGRRHYGHDIWRINAHIIFEKAIKYDLMTYYYEVLAGLGILDSQHVEMRKRRLDITLRISPKGTIPPPLPVIYHKHQGIDENIYAYFLALDAFREVPREALKITGEHETRGTLSLLRFTRVDVQSKRIHKALREGFGVFFEESADFALAIMRRREQIERERQKQAPYLFRHL